jgi:hypothetical protein
MYSFLVLREAALNYLSVKYRGEIIDCYHKQRRVASLELERACMVYIGKISSA